MSSDPERVSAYDEEEEEEEEEEGEESDSLGVQIRRMLRANFAAALLAQRVDAALAQQLQAGLRVKVEQAEDDGNGHAGTLQVVAGLALGASGLQLRFVYTTAEWMLSLHWRPWPARPGARGDGWLRLASASLCQSPPSGQRSFEGDTCAESYEQSDAGGLTRDSVAAMRAALFAQPAPRGRKRKSGEQAPGLSDHAMLELLFTAVGAYGLRRDFRVDIGHTWFPNAATVARMRADGVPLPDNIDKLAPTSWLQLAARAAAGASLPHDAYYSGVDVAAVKRRWGERVHEDTTLGMDDVEEDATGRVMGVRYEDLWDYALQHGRLPWQ